MTAASVAHGFFKREIETHKSLQSPSNLLVILHDACYGHRYSRPRTSKASLSTIVERPERILATVMGVSAAYVRLGGRYAGAGEAPHLDHNPQSIPFKIQKSSRFVPLVSPPVTSVHGTKWMNELKMMCEGAEAKLALGGKELVRPPQFGDPNGEDRAKLHEGDLYLCSESLDALEGALGGVFDAVDAAFDPSAPNRAFVAIRPPGHHCSDSYPSGFCWINNVHVGISHASAVHGLTHAAIIDFDLHHGDGSQSIAWAHNAKVASLPKNAAMSKRTAIGYFSLHDINSYPCEYGDNEKVKNASLCVENAHGQTIWNVHLQPWKTDAEFWELYENRYIVLLDKVRLFLQSQRDRLAASTNAPQPRAAIFISAGFDASEWEGQGMQRHKVNVPTDFYARFTRDIVHLAEREGLGVDGRVISVLEGGYSDRALTSGVLSHICGMAPNADGSAMKQSVNGLGYEMGQRLESLKLEGAQELLDPNWWSPSSLEELEAVVNPSPSAAPKKPRGPINPTYTTPTQSFAAKAVNPNVRRSLSGAMASTQRNFNAHAPVPEVEWTTAVHELSKVLTPDRQTRSCKHEDLNAKATELRRNRQSAIGVGPPTAPIDEGKRMQLRGRKAKAPSTQPDSRPSSRTSRRKTFGGTDGESDESSAMKGKAPRRRVSVASTILSTAEEDTRSSIILHEALATQRPSSSIIRPISATGSQTAVPLGKTRARPRSPLKQHASKKLGVASKTPAANAPSSKSQIPKPGVEPIVSDVDSLSSGVKKMSIKLNLPPKAEQEAREAKSKPIRVPRKSSIVPKVAKKAGPTPPHTATLPAVSELEPYAQTASTGALVPAADIVAHRPSIDPAADPALSFDDPPESDIQPALMTTLDDRLGPELQSTANNGDSTESKEYIPPPEATPPSFLPPDTETIPAPAGEASVNAQSVIASGPVHDSIKGSQMFVPMANDAISGSSSSASVAPFSSNRQSRKDLPVFTATSPILFGPHKPAAGGMYQALAAEAESHLAGTDANVNNGDKAMHPAVNGLSQKTEGSSRDIWGTPDTP